MRAVFLFSLIVSCTPTVRRPPTPPATDASHALAGICGENAPPPFVESVGNRVLVARGYDLANVSLIKTSAGSVVIDAGVGTKAGSAMKAALQAKAPGPIKALIFTHSHIDHVGGASQFVDSGTEIWATDAFPKNFLKQYGLYQPIEMLRGIRQYGQRVPRDFLPCTAIGPIPDFEDAAHSGARLPNKTFSRHHKMTIGDVPIELVEAHGETHDQLFVWLPEQKILFAGDNIYKAFPNLYTIRGTSPRPIDDWIESLDAMRRLEPEVLVPGHTGVVVGKDKIREILTVYRDGIQWLRDATVRGANAGLSPDQLAETLKLPSALAAHPYLQESYGQVDWSVRGVYSDNLGWFGGEADRLILPDSTEAARREVELMGGPERVLQAGEGALSSGDVRWAVHLLSKLRDSGTTKGKTHEQLRDVLVKAFNSAASSTFNTNGRGYLAESAVEVLNGRASLPMASPDETLLQAIPLDVFLIRMGTLLSGSKAAGVHETLRIEFPDANGRYFLTVRNGLVEMARGVPLPGTPTPVAGVTVDSLIWKKLALRQIGLAAAVTADGGLKVDGSWLDFAAFMRRFDIE